LLSVTVSHAAPGENATAALELASATLAAEDAPGASLFVLDDLDPADHAAFASDAESRPPVVFLAIGPDSQRAAFADMPQTDLVTLTVDDTDVAEIERRVASAFRDALSGDERQAWEDRAWWLAWPAALLVLAWFRRGWTMRWALALAAGLGPMAEDVRAEGIADWFLTPDQQGRLAYEDNDYARAVELFQDPMWRGQSLYRDGQYEAAAEVFARVPSAEAAFAEGMSRMKSRGYREGIAAFEVALERHPDHTAAARNLEIARAILAYVETTREDSGTEKGSEGADDVAFDNDAAQGAETVVDTGVQMKMETAEQWMRSVDTRTADFLRTRFALEAAGARP
jgi:Ca-activated chloride channel family protein